MAECLSCQERIGMDEAMARVEAGEDAPECLSCGGMLKPATISFGQPMPVIEMRMASLLSRQCEVFIAVGSSLEVYPAASFPEMAKRHGARLIIVNRTSTPLDRFADLVINDEIGRVLPLLTSMEDGIRAQAE